MNTQTSKKEQISNKLMKNWNYFYSSKRGYTSDYKNELWKTLYQLINIKNKFWENSPIYTVINQKLEIAKNIGLDISDLF